MRSRARNALLNAAIVNEERVEHSIEDLLKMKGIDEDTARALASKEWVRRTSWPIWTLKS